MLGRRAQVQILGRRAQVQILGRKAGTDPGKQGTGVDLVEESRCRSWGGGTGADSGDFFLNEMHDHWKITDRQTVRQMQPLDRLLWVPTLSRLLAAKMDQ